MRFIPFFILSLFILSCSSEKEEEYLASYKDVNLSLSEVYSQIIPGTIDTANFVDLFVINWLKQQVLFDKASIYISDTDQEIQQKVQDFKETIIIHKYQNELINNEFDTTLTEIEISDYYEKFLKDFILNQHILKCKLIIVEKDFQNKKELEKKIVAQTSSQIDELLNYCQLYSNIYYLNDSNWVYLSEILQKLPTNIDSKKLIRYKNKIHSFTDEELRYFLFVKDFEIKGKKSPLSFELSKIRNLLQNKKKIQYLEKIEDELYRNALSSGKIKIY